MTRRKMIWLIGFVLVCAAEHHPLTVQAESNQVLRDAYTSYIRDTLVPLYGVLETDTAEPEDSSDPCGMLSASIMDFNDDGKEDLLVVRYTTGGDNRSYLNLQMYEYQDSGVVEESTQKAMRMVKSFGYYQTCVFTYKMQNKTYIGIDNYLNANSNDVTLSVFEYGETPLVLHVPHTTEVQVVEGVMQPAIKYIGGAGYQHYGGGNIYVKYADSEPTDQLYCESWSWKKKYAEDIDPVLSEEEKEEYIDAYRALLEQYSLRAEDERIGMSQNGKYRPVLGEEPLERAPDIYSAAEGEITFLSGIYTDPDENRNMLVSRVDYQGSLDEFRGK